MNIHSKIREMVPRDPQGYAHWSGTPVTPGDHSRVKLVPQSMVDSWEAYCSCGEWLGIASMYDFDRDDAIAALKAAYERHMMASLKAAHERGEK